MLIVGLFLFNVGFSVKCLDRIYLFLRVFAFGLFLVFISGCRDTRTAESTLGTAGSAIRDNDFETFKVTLMNPALREWGTVDHFQSLRALIPNQQPQIMALELLRKESCGHNSCVHRFYEAQIGVKSIEGANQVLATVSILCRKVAKHRECWIYDILPQSVVSNREIL